jgi:hypothetical protein
MQFYNTAGAAASGYAQTMGEAITLAFRTLLETKHLYQSVAIDEESARARFLPLVEAKIKDHGMKTGAYGLSPAVVSWILSSDMMMIVGAMNSSEAKPHFIFNPPHVKMFCRTCDRIEPFNLVTAQSDIDLQKFRPAGYKQEQVYTLTYLCQGCKQFPEVVLVRRTGGKLTLSGKTPMEYVGVPAAIPKEIDRFYSGAVIAFQSGQPLAALFMLRTAHEQWARRWAISADKADQALDKYMASLPNDFKDRFPSFKEMYGQLSADIHAATGSETLFNDISTKFIEHFEARRLYKLEPPK